MGKNRLLLQPDKVKNILDLKKFKMKGGSNEDIINIIPYFSGFLATIYFIWAFNKRTEKLAHQKEIMKAGDRGEYKVQAVLTLFEKPNSRYKVYHNIKLGPDTLHTNEYDSVVLGRMEFSTLKLRTMVASGAGLLMLTVGETGYCIRKTAILSLFAIRPAR